MGGGFESTRGIDTPKVEELPCGDKSSKLTPEGDSMTGEYGWGQGGDGNPPTTRETEASGYSSIDEDMTSGLGPAPPSSPQGVTAADRGNKERPYRHPDSANGASSERK